MSNIDFTIKAVELTKLDLQPGQTLAVTVKSDDFDGDSIDSLKAGLQKTFPNNKILIFGIGLNDSLNFTAISENNEISSCATGQFCVDCNCGKKEQYEKQS